MGVNPDNSQRRDRNRFFRTAEFRSETYSVSPSWFEIPDFRLLMPDFKISEIVASVIEMDG
jgi:hypothetical protein